MQRDQVETNRQSLGMLQDQDHALDQARVLEQPAALPVLPRMTAADDVQSFLDSFEAVAWACRWPRSEWAVRLLPLLAGEAETAALGLPPKARRSYADVRKAVTVDQRRRINEVQTSAWVRCHYPTALGTAITRAEVNHPSSRGDGGRAPASARPTPAPPQIPSLPIPAPCSTPLPQLPDPPATLPPRVVAVRAARTRPEGVLVDGSRTGNSGCRLSDALQGSMYRIPVKEQAMVDTVYDSPEPRLSLRHCG